MDRSSASFLNTSGGASHHAINTSTSAATSGAAMDPILARYINLKRQMDGNTSAAASQSRGASVSASASASSYAAAAASSSFAAAAAAPHGSLLNTSAAGGAVGSRFGTPTQRHHQLSYQHQPSQHNTPRGHHHHHNHSSVGFGEGVPTASSSYASFLSTHQQQQHGGHHHHDPRAILQSPKAGGGGGSGVEAGMSPSLRRRLATRAEAEAHFASAQAAESRRHAADAELLESRGALRQQQMDLDDALGKLEASERQLRATRDALERAEEGRGEAEARLTVALRDAEVAKASAKAHGVSALKVLEGKVAALQSEVASREEALRAAAGRQHELETELRRRDQHVDNLTHAAMDKDRAGGEAALEAEGLRSEISRLRKALEDVAVDGRLRADRFDQQEAASREREMAMEQTAMATKEELRAAKRALSQLEVSSAAASEQLREAEAAAARLGAEVRELRAAAEEAEAGHRDTVAKLEALRTRSAQDAIMVDQSRYESEAARGTIASLKKEAAARDERIAALEGLAERGEEERRHRQSLEAQLSAVTASLEAAREEAAHGRRRAEEQQRRIEALSREADTVPHLQEKISALSTVVDAKTAAIEKSHAVEQSLRDDYASLAAEARLLGEHKAQLAAEGQRLDGELKAKNSRIDELLTEVQKKNALHGEIEALSALLQERDRRIAGHAAEQQKWHQKCRELDEDVDALLDVKRQFDELVASHRAVFAQLEERNREFETLRSAGDALAEQLALKDQECRELNALLMESDAKAQRLAASVADKAALESRLRQTSAELAAVRTEAASEKDRREEQRAKVQQRDEALAVERSARSDAEERYARTAEELAEAQVQLGKATVRLEAFDKECRRLTSEAEVRGRQLESLTEGLAAAQREAQTAGGDVKEAKFKEAHAAQRIEQLSADVTRLEAANAALSAAAKAGDERAIICDRLSEKVRTIEYQNATLEGRLADVTAELKERTQQISENAATMARQQAEIANYEKTNQRLTEAKALAERQSSAVDALEKEDAAKSRQLMEKEREASRLREKVALLSADLETERGKKRSLEARAKDLERECERASTLDGQVAGLTMVVQQRSRALEEEQEACRELRGRLARLSEHHRASTSAAAAAASISRAGSVSIHQHHHNANLSSADGSGGEAGGGGGFEARIAVKDEIIRQLEAEERRRAEVIEGLRADLAASEERLASTEASLRDAREQLRRAEGRCGDLEAELRRSNANGGGNKESAEAMRLIARLEAELADANSRASALSDELRGRERELRRAEALMRPAAITSTNNASTAPAAVAHHTLSSSSLFNGARSGSASSGITSADPHSAAAVAPVASSSSMAAEGDRDRELELAIARAEERRAAHLRSQMTTNASHHAGPSSAIAVSGAALDGAAAEDADAPSPFVVTRVSTLTGRQRHGTDTDDAPYGSVEGGAAGASTYPSALPPSSSKGANSTAAPTPSGRSSSDASSRGASTRGGTAGAAASAASGAPAHVFMPWASSERSAERPAAAASGAATTTASGLLAAPAAASTGGVGGFVGRSASGVRYIPSALSPIRHDTSPSPSRGGLSSLHSPFR